MDWPQCRKQKYTSLQDFEKFYSDVGPENYVWFQSNFSQLAKQIYDLKGFSFIETLRKNPFPEKNALPIEYVLQRLEKITPGFIEWSKQFKESVQIKPEEQELIALEHKWNAAFWRRDIRALDSLMADDIIITYGNGKMANKKQELASFETGIESSSLDDFKVKLYGDVAVVMFRLMAKGPRFNATNIQFRYTDVFVKRDGRWQCVISHNTRVEKQ